MIPGTHSNNRHRLPETHGKVRFRARVRLRAERYLAAFAAIGVATDAARSRTCDVDPKSVTRALKGKQVGERFIAQTIAALAQEEHREQLAEIGIEPTMDSLFEVIVEAVA